MSNYETKYVNGTRTRKILSLFGFIIINGKNNDFVSTGKWFKFITIKERKRKVRYLLFDDGWTYTFFWSKWKTEWEFVEIIK